MSRTSRALIFALVVIALPAFAGSASAAIRWPHFHVNKLFIILTESREIEASAKTVIKIKTTGGTLECKSLKLKKGALIKGGQAGTNEETIEFEGCSVSGTGFTKCVVTSVAAAKDGKVITNPLKSEGVYLEKPAEPVVKNTMAGMYFAPVTGTVLATVKFEIEPGGACLVAETKIEGSVAGESLESGELLVGFEEHESEGEKTFIRFITKNIAQVWKGKEGATAAEAVEAKPALKAFVLTAELEGTITVKLTSKESWGVFVAL